MGAPLTERLIDAGGVELCTQAFGDPADPPVLLVMGTGASMLWWDEDLCRRLAGGGRFVVRYDHRDTGRSTTDPPGAPRYTGADLVRDAAAVLDGHGIAAAHLVGVSAGGGIAQHLALGDPGRVLSLVLVSTSPATPGDRGLPGPAPAFGRFVATATVDWEDRDSVIEYLAGYQRMLLGEVRPVDEHAVRDLVRRDVERARDIRAVVNHDVLEEGDVPSRPLAALDVPTLVVHGTADPLFPLAHGEALAAEIPGARLLVLEGAGHGVDRADWDVLAAAILEHTAGTGH